MLAVSVCTIRRRIQEGELSARKSLHGRQEVWTIDAAELARYAQSTGQALTTEPGNHGQRRAQKQAIATVDHGQSMAQSQANADEVLTLRAELERHREAAAALRQEVAFLREVVLNLSQKALPAALDERAQAAERIAQLEAVASEAQERMAKLQEEVEALRRQLSRSWWQRLFGIGRVGYDGEQAGRKATRASGQPPEQ